MVDSELSEANGNVKSNGPPHNMGQSQPQNNLSPQKPLEEPLKCPECGSNRIWKDGYRYTDKGPIQRFLCRFCGYRFSESKVKFNVGGEVLEVLNSEPKLSNGAVACVDSSLKVGSNLLPFKRGEYVASHSQSQGTIIGKGLNIFGDYNRNCRVCGWKAQPKNSARQKAREMENASQTGKWTAGATETTKAEPDVKGVILEYAWWMKKQGYSELTIQTRVKVLNRLAKLGANLYEPENVKEAIAKQPWKVSTKAQTCAIYGYFAKFKGLSWEPPIYKPNYEIPFIPTEAEIDMLIAASGKKLSALLQLIKETGIRIGEACKIKWTDFDSQQRIIKVQAEKGSKPRIFRLSEKCVNMLNRVPKVSERIFPNNPRGLETMFRAFRNRLAHKLGNPRLKEIRFHTIRHWRATMLYHQTKDILHVKEFLGHRSLDSTLIYINVETPYSELETQASSTLKSHIHQRRLKPCLKWASNTYAKKTD